MWRSLRQGSVALEPRHLSRHPECCQRFTTCAVLRLLHREGDKCQEEALARRSGRVAPPPGQLRHGLAVRLRRQPPLPCHHLRPCLRRKFRTGAQHGQAGRRISLGSSISEERAAVLRRLPTITQSRRAHCPRTIRPMIGAGARLLWLEVLRVQRGRPQHRLRRRETDPRQLLYEIHDVGTTIRDRP